MKSRIKKDSWIITRPAAHRGLHGAGIAENSNTAFTNAMENNYPIETDVQITSDGEIVIFHDDNLKRMTGLDCLIRNLTYADTQKLRLGNTEDKIIKFDEFLKLIGGKVPLLIEIKTQPEKGITDKVLAALKDYKGEFAIQSFDPRQILEVKKKRPDILRGQLATPKKDDKLPKIKNFVLTKMPLNFLTKPDFINTEVTYLPVKKKYRKYKILCWTVKDEEQKKKAETYADSYVFENVRP